MKIDIKIFLLAIIAELVTTIAINSQQNPNCQDTNCKICTVSTVC